MAWDWLLTAGDMAVAVGCMLLAWLILQGSLLGVAPWWHCLDVAACHAVISLWLPPVALRRGVRADEMMQTCFRKAVLLFVLACASLTLFPSLDVPHVTLLLFALYFAMALFAEWLLVRGIAVAVRSRRVADEGVGEGWEVYELPLPAEPLSNAVARWQKRGFDLLLATLSLLTFFPVVYLVMLCITIVRKHGSVLSLEHRQGARGRLFIRIRFRYGKGAVRDLPMLLNVLTGSMSLVGPRVRERRSEGTALHLKPGLVGCGRRGVAWYARHWTFWLDVCVLLRAVVGRQ